MNMCGLFNKGGLFTNSENTDRTVYEKINDFFYFERRLVVIMTGLS